MGLTKKQFKDLKNGYIDGLAEEDVSLSVRANRYWMGVEKNDPSLFTKKEKLIDSIQQLKKDDLIEFFSTKIIGAGKISVQIYSSLDKSSAFTDDAIT